ncbi:MAG TPA: heavy metal response regulator transcription factor [Spirochaetota bacterium]|jgi:heavy metal response regulator|nr:MAG: Transcriptional activator protein CzcR [Spirochaetes bacterium ADurb.Bin133]HNZ26920.1 heavy metal response regulator transcription factor [Spirochaetota bacterium]HOF00738.1 heavy metal response regulator transcription factor [Spirochaetota bacterium]HOS32505.1 heavy metal response regulator transcription factor [Spirochaetota bacterium]HOS56023.1 heavy metal response regulator transcription factor [Spirochaetota bacterium]
MRILVVEDEEKIANFIKRGLKEEGYVVDIAGDGEEGLYLALNHSFDLIVLDLMLPIKDGLTVCAELREKGKNIPILILTAKNSTQDKVSGLDLGANDYITKPFAFEEFLARIRALLRNKNNSESTRLKIHDLDMDLLAHKVYRGGKEIALTSKEFSLLEYLMRNKGSIVTRTMITEHVWEINFDSFTNVIDVYINYLRNKIDKGYDKKLIHTVRSRGYSIKE